MNFTTTNMTEQLVQNMYQKSVKETSYMKNDKTRNNQNTGAATEEEAAVYEGSVRQPAKATYTKPVSLASKKDKNLP